MFQIEEHRKKKEKILQDNFEIDESQNRKEKEDDANYVSPPTLYVRPKIEDIKEMFRTYLEIKKSL